MTDYSNNNGSQHPILNTILVMLLIFIGLVIVLTCIHSDLFMAYFGKPRNLSFFGSLQLIGNYIIALFERTFALA